MAARSHRTAAEHNEKGDLPSADYHLARAMEYSDRAYKLSKEALDKSHRIESLQENG